MILNKLWNGAKKLSHSLDENNKPVVEEKRLVVDISGRKKKLRNLYHIVGFGIPIIFFILLLFLIVSILPYSDYKVCFTCFPHLAEKIITKQNHNMHLDLKYDQTTPNSKTFSDKSSNSSVLETIGKVSSDETSTLRNLNEESVIIRGKNKVPENIEMLEDIKKLNTVSKTELPQTFSVNERKYDSKHNITKDVHQINSEDPLSVNKQSSFYNDSSNSNSILLNKLKKIRKVTSTETPTLINLDQQSVIIRGKNTVPEKIWIVKDIQAYNLSKTELPHTISVNEHKYDSKHNVTNGMHQINGEAPLTVGKLSNSYNNSSNSNFLLRNILKKFPLKVPTVKIVPAIRRRHESVPSISNTWMTNDNAVVHFSKTNFGKHTLEDKKNINIHSGLESTPQLNPMNINESEDLTDNDDAVNENTNISYYPIESSAAENESAMKNEFEDDSSIQDQWASNEMIFPSISETTIAEYRLEDAEDADMHSGLKLTHSKNGVFKNKPENSLNAGRIVGENLSHSYHPIKSSYNEKAPSIKYEFEDDPAIQDQWTSNKMIFPFVSETPVVEYKLEELKNADMHSGFKLTHQKNRSLKNELENIFNIGKIVGENHSHLNHPIKTSDVQKVSPIKNKFEDDHSVQNKWTINDMLFLPLSKTTLDKHSQKETKKNDMHSGYELIRRINREIKNESEDTSYIGSNVEENFSISHSPIENIPAIKYKYENDTFVPGQLISSDITFLPLSDSYSTNRSIDDNPSIQDYPIETSADETISTIKDKNEDDTFVSGQMISSDNTLLPLSDPYSIDRNVPENPSVSYPPIETSAVENIPAIKDKYEDDTFVPGQLISSDNTFLPLSDPYSIDRNVNGHPSISNSPIETSATENLSPIKHKYEDDNSVPGQIMSSAITLLPLSDPYSIDRDVGENPSISYSPIETSLVENVPSIKDKYEDDTFVPGQLISSDITFLPLPDRFRIDRSVSENPSIPYSPIETSAVENISAMVDKYEDGTFVPGQLISSDNTFLPHSDPYSIDRNIGENPSISHSPIETSAVKNISAIKDKYVDDIFVSGQMISSDDTYLPHSDLYSNDGTVGENLSVSYFPIEASAVENIPAIEDKYEDNTFVPGQLISSDITFLPLSDPYSIDRNVDEKPSISYSPIETSAVGNIPEIKDKYEDDTFVPGQLISSDITFLPLSDPHRIDRSVGENPSVSHSPIEISVVENIPAIKDKYEDDTFEPGQSISSDITFLPLSDPYNIDRNVGGNPSISYPPIETSAVENIPAIKDKYEDDTFEPGQSISSDITFLPFSDPYNIDRNVGGNPSISYSPIETSAVENLSPIHKYEDDNFVQGQFMSSDITFLPLLEPYSIDRSVGENPSISFSPIETSAVGNIPEIKDKYEDDTFVPGQLISSDITFLPLSDPHRIDRSVGENPSVSHSPIEISVVENIPAIKDKYEDDTFEPGQSISSDITFLPLSDPYNIDRNVGGNPSISYPPIETSAVGNIPEIKDKYEDDTFVPGQLISSDITFLPLSDPHRIDRSVGENPSVSHSPIEISVVENIPAIKDKYEDDTFEPGQSISSDITFLPLSDPYNIDRNVGGNPSISYPPIETSAVENIPAIKDKYEDDTFEPGQSISSDITFLPLSDPYNIDRNVGGNPSISYSPIETSAVENLSPIHKYEDDNFVQGQFMSSDITFLPLLEPYSIDRSVGENPSISYSPIETSAVGNVPEIKDKYEDEPSTQDYPIETSSVEKVLPTKNELEGYLALLDQRTSNDMIFQFPMQPKFDSHLLGEKEKTKLHSNLELTSRVNTAIRNEMGKVSNIDENVDENLSTSYYSTETSVDENGSILKNEDEDFYYVLNP